MKIKLRDGTGEIDLKYVGEDVDRHGRVRVYVRRHGRKIRILETPGTDEFLAAYRAALEDTKPAAKPKAPTPASADSLRGLMERYYASAEFKRLGGSTRRVRRNLLDRLCQAPIKGSDAQIGDMPFGTVRSINVRQLRDQKAELPEAANARVKALRQVFGWAFKAGIVDRNPAHEVEYINAASEGYHTWTLEEVRQFEARHPIGSKARLALALLLYTGVRRSDVVRLGRQMETADGCLRFTEAKGRNKLVKEREIPLLPELRAIIKATPSGNLTYLVTAFGKPFSPVGFSNWLKRRCREAGLPHCSAHGLRKAAATIAVERGATEHQLMAIFGWESSKQAAIYTRKADRKRLAKAAMHLLVPAESVPPGRVVRSGGTIRGKKA